MFYYAIRTVYTRQPATYDHQCGIDYQNSRRQHVVSTNMIYVREKIVHPFYPDKSSLLLTPSPTHDTSILTKA